MSTLKFDDLYVLTFKDMALNDIGRQRFAEWVIIAQNSNVPAQFTKAFQKEWFRYQVEDSSIPQYSLIVDTLHPIWSKICHKLLKLDHDMFRSRHATFYALSMSRLKQHLELKEQVREHLDTDLLPQIEQHGKQAYEYFKSHPNLESGLGIDIDSLIAMRSKFNMMSSDYLDIQTEVGRQLNMVDDSERDAILTLGLLWRDMRISTYGNVPGVIGLAYKAIRTVKRLPTTDELMALQMSVEKQFLNKQVKNDVLLLGQ